MKWMGVQNPANGEITDIKLYAPHEQGGPNLVEVDGPPAADSHCYVLGAGSPPEVVVAPTNLSLEVGTSSVSEITVISDNVDSVIVELIGPNNAEVMLDWDGALSVDKASLTLDGSGHGQVTFGPTTLRSPNGILVRFKTPNGSAALPAELLVKFN